MKHFKHFLIALVLLALPVTASAYTITWDDLNGNADVTVTAIGGNFETKTIGGVSGVGISGGVASEINQGEAMSFVFASSQYVNSLSLAFLYPDGEYDDTANEIATIQAVSGGATYTYTLTATGWTTADWTGSGSVDNLAEAKTGSGGAWELTDPFGGMAVDSVLLTVLSASSGSRCPTPCGNNFDFAFTAMTTTPTPIPGAVWLLGAGLLGLVGYKKRLRG